LTQEIDRLKIECIKYKSENIKLHKEANIAMQEICRLRGQVAKLRSKIIRMKGVTSVTGCNKA
jgi:hypothetical protein